VRARAEVRDFLGYLTLLHRELNLRFWGGSLRRPTIILLGPDDVSKYLPRNADATSSGRPLSRAQAVTIRIRMPHDPLTTNYWVGLMLHEMVHQAIGLHYDHSSKKWRDEVQRLAEEGALEFVL